MVIAAGSTMPAAGSHSSSRALQITSDPGGVEYSLGRMPYGAGRATVLLLPPPLRVFALATAAASQGNILGGLTLPFDARHSLANKAFSRIIISRVVGCQVPHND